MPETVKLNRAIKYRIYPDDHQKEVLAQTFGCARKVYNMGLELQNGLYASGMGSMSKTDLNNFCNHEWKDEFPYLRDVDKFSLTNSIFRLDQARQNFFEGRARYPHFKSRKDKQSYTTNMTNGNISIVCGEHGTGWVKLPKLGYIKAELHRLPEDGWMIKNATVTLSTTGNYCVSIGFEIFKEVPVVTPTLETTYGLDYSSPHFAVDSDGNRLDPPKWYRESEKRLAREQRRLSRMTQGSKNYQKQKLVVARLHERVVNQRKDYLHKLSRETANSYTVVCVEDLDLTALSRSLNFGKTTSDNGFGMFRNFLEYKLEEQGKYFVKVDKWYPSSKTCNCCGGYYHGLKLGQESWVCPHCGRTIDRDWNAGLNIKEEGFRTLLSVLEAAVQAESPADSDAGKEKTAV